MRVLICTHALLLLLMAQPARAQVLGPDFVSSYEVLDLGAVTGVPTSYGGLTFMDGDPDTLLVGGAAGTPSGAIYAVPVFRDAAGHVNAFGAPTQIAGAPDIDSGLAYGPNGVLFFTTWPSNTLGQFLPGSTLPDKVVDLTALGVAPSTGGLAFAPVGFPGAGGLKLSTFLGNECYDADLAADGMGTFDVLNATSAAVTTGGPQGLAFVESSHPGFSVMSLLMCEHITAEVAAFELDANGIPLVATRRPFLLGFTDPEGIAVDPLTGDFVFSSFGGASSRLVRVSLAAIGTSYCPLTPNSAGAGSMIAASGGASVASNDLGFQAGPMAAGEPGIFYYGPDQLQVPFGNGNRCVGGGPGTIVRMFPFAVADASGFMSATLDNTGPAHGQVVPGATLNFQGWFRDPAAGGTGFNLSDGLSLTFTP